MKDTKNNEGINNDYWLNWAKNASNETFNELKNGAEDLKIFVLWLWSIYTSIFSSGLIVLKISGVALSNWAVVLLAIPIVSLIFSYFLCFLAKSPVTEEINDARVPLLIQMAYTNMVKRKERRLKIALCVVLFSAFSLSIGLGLAFIEKNVKQLQEFEPVVDACLNYAQDSILVSGIFPEKTLIMTKIEVSDSVNKSFPIFVKSEQLQSSVYFLHHGVEKNAIKNEIDSVFITIIWSFENVKNTLEKKIYVRKQSQQQTN